MLKKEAGKTSLWAGKTSLANEIPNLCDSRSFLLKFDLFISSGRHLPRQQFAVLRTFRLGFIEWGVSPAYALKIILCDALVWPPIQRFKKGVAEYHYAKV